MKTIFATVVSSLTLTLAAQAVTPEDLIEAVDRMSPDQAFELKQKLDAKLLKPVPPAFFTRMAFDFGTVFSIPDTVDLGAMPLSGGEMDLDPIEGFDFGILWEIADPRFRLGFRFGGWSAIDSNLGDGGYSRAELAGGHASLAANCQWVRSKSWLLWTEVAPGMGAVALETLNTPAGQATTVREFSEAFGLVDLQSGVSMRINPIFSIYVSGGYRFAEAVDLEEGGRRSDVEFDASGFIARCGVGINF